MPAQPTHPASRRPALLPVAGAAAIACAALLGELLDSRVLQSFTGTTQAMVPTTAIVVLVACAALALAVCERNAGAVMVLAGVVTLLGGVTLAEYAFGVDLGVDTVAGTGFTLPDLEPGRMAMTTAIALTVCGASIIMLDRGGGAVRLSQAGALAIAYVALFALMGYIFDVPALQRGLGSPLTPMSLPAIAAVLLLSAGLLMARPGAGLAALARSPGPGGTLLRRAAPAVVVLPIGIAYVLLLGERAGWYEPSEGLALLCAALVALFGVLVLVMARRLELLDIARRAGVERERAIVESAADAIVAIDGDGRIVEFNRAAERIFGRPRAAAMGSELAELLVPPALRADCRAGLARMAGGGEPRILGRPVELTAMRADGSEFPAEITVSPLGGGGAARYVGQIRDITERLESERALRLTAAVVESSDDAIVAVDNAGLVTSWNTAATRMYGYSADEAIGSELVALIVPGERQAAIAPEAARLREPGADTLIREVEHVRKDGSRLFVAATVSAIRGPDGEAAGLAVIARDATERKGHEAELRRLAAIVESSLDAIVMFDATGTIRVWNPAAERVNGYAADEIVGRPISTLAADDPATGKGMDDILRGEMRVDEGRATRKDGRIIRVRYSAFPIREADDVIAVGLTVRDVTEQLKLEDRLRQAQKMEAVGQLAGGVAHDFNNLLTAIAGYGDLARAAIGSGPGAGELAEIERATVRAASLTRQLLAFSRRQLLDPVVLDLSELARGLLPMLKRLISEDISVEARRAEALPGVIADAGQLEQVVLNLAINARDAMPDGGVLTIETSLKRLDDEAGGVEHVCLSISDTGVGIERAALEHIFEPFYTTKSVGEGTGLGLATVHGVVTQSDGRVEVYSEPGLGTTFRVFLPATGTVSEPVVTVPAETGPALGETILVCEDEEPVRRLLARILEGGGYIVLAAADPDAAIALARAAGDSIDCLVSDVIMPGMPGPELARRLHGELPRLRTLFISGYTADTIERRGSLPTGSAFLEEPFNREVLLHTVRELLDRAPAT